MFDLAANRGATLVLITHDPALAARCDRAIRLVDGQIDSRGDTSSDDNGPTCVPSTPPASETSP